MVRLKLRVERLQDIDYEVLHSNMVRLKHLLLYKLLILQFLLHSNMVRLKLDGLPTLCFSKLILHSNMVRLKLWHMVFYFTI